jgi:hypothetical protein
MRDGEIDEREREGAAGGGSATTVVVGPDEDGLGAALADAGEEVRRVEGVPTGEALRAAGADDADLFVLTDIAEATTIAVVKETNPEVRVVVYDDDSLPAFASGQADIAVDPALLGPETVAEELTNGAGG